MPTLAVKDLTLEQKEYLTSFYGFCKEFLGMELYDDVETKGADWQKRVMQDLDKSGARVSLCTANGVGKTSKIVTGFVLWMMAVHPKALVTSTAGAFRQVKTQLFPNLMNYQHKFPDWNFKPGSLEIDASNGSRYIGFSTDDPGKAEGYHGNKEEIYDLINAHVGPLAVILDEAKTVPDSIKEAIERCTYLWQLLCSSPGFAEGFFYDSQTKSAQFYTTYKIPQRGRMTRNGVCFGEQVNRHVDFPKSQRLIDELGVDNPLVRSSIFAEFMGSVEGCIIPMETVEKCLSYPPQHISGIRIGMCDFAAGGDENVFGIRDGNKITLVKCWREKNTMVAAAEFVKLFREHNLRPENIGGDADGLGKPFMDALETLGWRIQALHNGSTACKPEYKNLGSQIWFEGATKMQNRDFILPEDAVLKHQLSSRKQVADLEEHKLACEPKKKMKERGESSPDRAETVLHLMNWRTVSDPLDIMGRGSAERQIPDFYLNDSGHLELAETTGLPGLDAGW